MNEIWVSVMGFEKYYEVSSHGQIRRLQPRTCAVAGAIRKLHPQAGGYLRVALSGDGIKWQTTVHRIVADAFLGPCPKGKQINHKDGVKTNNHYTNLEYVTASENMQHAYDTGLKVALPNPHLKARGEQHGNTKLTEADIRTMLKLSAAGVNDCELARMYPTMARRSICSITNRKTWKHVTISEAEKVEVSA